jgi:hypothetical protein
VGDCSVKTLAENYANHYARAAATAATQSESSATQQYNTHFFLDVPADKSGSRPHQALINFNDNQTKQRNSSKANAKKKNSAKQREVDATTATTSPKDEREIFKIQIAAPIPGMEDTPMLLYNATKDARTFIHPPTTTTNQDNNDQDDDDGSYFTIRQMIQSSGTTGALGKSGGTKAYFWGVVRTVNVEQGKKRIVSLDIGELAPSQFW